MALKTIAIVFFVVVQSHGQQESCAPRSYGLNSVVCVCNATYCDTTPYPIKLSSGQYMYYTSTASGLRFKTSQGELKRRENKRGSTVITVNSNKHYQSILGWGGAFTDSTGINILSLSEKTGHNLMRSYFAKDGLEYNLCRVPIAGTDFSTHGYSYDDGPSDPQLLNFTLCYEDLMYKIPLIHSAHNLTQGQLELFADSWSSPKWMKTNGEYEGPGSLMSSMYQPWANYMIKFLQEYKSKGIEFWGITTGNEPIMGLGPTPIPSVGWEPTDMGKWVAENLGPALRASEFSSLKLITVNGQTPLYTWYADLMFENEKVEQYVDGFGVHWYWNWLRPQALLTRTHNKYPDKFILATEASTGGLLSLDHVRLGDWNRAERYAEDIILDLNNWVTGWIDWNMALNEMGGPTYINNFLDAPIIVNATADEFYKQPMYYALGHFVKFIPKGSVRVPFKQSDDKIKLVAFQRPDNGLVVVILNKRNSKVPVKLRYTKRKEITRMLQPKSISTFLCW